MRTTRPWIYVVTTRRLGSGRSSDERGAQKTKVGAFFQVICDRNLRVPPSVNVYLRQRFYLLYVVILDAFSAHTRVSTD